MIIEKLFRIIKNPALRNSWVAKSRILQEGLITCFLLYNSVASKTGLFKKRIGRSCGKRNVIDPHAVVASNNLILGNDCHICANVVLGPSTRIGDNVIIESGTIVGSEGFEIRRIGDRLIPVVHVGGVNICNNVVIGSHVCIDKSLSGKSTEISEHSWIGDYVHVAHGVRIGKHCTIASSVMIGGKVTIGDAVRIGYGTKISDQISIGNRAIISPGSVVTKDVPDGHHITGNFAISHEKFLEHFRKIN